MLLVPNGMLNLSSEELWSLACAWQDSKSSQMLNTLMAGVDCRTLVLLANHADALAHFACLPHCQIGFPEPAFGARAESPPPLLDPNLKP